MHFSPPVRGNWSASPVLTMWWVKLEASSRSLRTYPERIARRMTMPENQRTFVMVKPDGVRRGLVGEVIKRIETKGYRIAEMKLFTIDESLAKEHYGEHSE